MTSYTFQKTSLGNYNVKLDDEIIGKIAHTVKGWNLNQYNGVNSEQQKIWKQFRKNQSKADYRYWLYTGDEK